MQKQHTQQTAEAQPENSAKVQMPWIQTYGNYSSSNYGAHALQVRVGNATVYFSYETPVAFRIGSGPLVVRENDWSTTTGKHLNAIDGGDKKSRVSGAKFERLYSEAISQ